VFENTDQTAAVRFCSDAASPVTAAFDYGDGVCSFSGVRNGQLCWYDNENAWERRTLTCARCSSSASPFFGAYFFNHGSSAFFTCDTARFSINATATLPNPVNASATTTVSSLHHRWCHQRDLHHCRRTIRDSQMSSSSATPQASLKPDHGSQPFPLPQGSASSRLYISRNRCRRGIERRATVLPRASLTAQLERAHHQLVPEEAEGSNGSWA
jgi:hypothetical protein